MALIIACGNTLIGEYKGVRWTANLNAFPGKTYEQVTEEVEAIMALENVGSNGMEKG